MDRRLLRRIAAAGGHRSKKKDSFVAAAVEGSDPDPVVLRQLSEGIFFLAAVVIRIELKLTLDDFLVKASGSPRQKAALFPPLKFDDDHFVATWTRSRGCIKRGSVHKLTLSTSAASFPCWHFYLRECIKLSRGLLESDIDSAGVEEVTVRPFLKYSWKSPFSDGDFNLEPKIKAIRVATIDEPNALAEAIAAKIEADFDQTADDFGTDCRAATRVLASRVFARRKGLTSDIAREGFLVSWKETFGQKLLPTRQADVSD